MSAETWTAVDQYFTDLLTRPDAALEQALQHSRAAGLPDIAVSANLGKLLQLLAMSHGARRILELGTLGGYSTIWLARALPPGGRLVTLEAEALHAEVARANIQRAGVAGSVELRLGPALETLPRLVAEKAGPFDFIFLDADKPSYPDYLPWMLRLSRSGTLIIADNVVRDGTVIDANTTDPKTQGVRRFNELVAAEPRLDATVVQMTGVKGYDGFALMLVKE